MAGNWKMNLNHLEAIALTQKLALLADRRGLRGGRRRDPAAVHRHPVGPDADRRRPARLVYGAQDLSAARLRRVHRRRLRPDAGQARLHVRRGRPLRAAAVPRRGRRRSSTRRSRPRSAHGLVPILCVGEGLDVRRAGEHVGHTPGPARRRVRRRRGGPGPDRRRRLRAGLGDRHRRGGHPAGRPGGVRARSGPGWPSSTAATWPTTYGSSTAGR